MEGNSEVIGFQFEPVRSAPVEGSYSDGSDLELETVHNNSNQRSLRRMHQNVEEWCKCKYCKNMPTDIECLCCKEIPEIQMYHLNNGKRQYS